MSVKVNICGLTNLSDATAAAAAGADILGFVFHETSPRFVTIEKAAQLSAALPASTVKAGVFVNPSSELVFRAVKECGLSILQFHGDESPAYCLQFGIMTIKAFQIRDGAWLEDLPAY